MRYWTKYKLEKKKIPKKLVFKVATFVVPGIDFANLKKKLIWLKRIMEVKKLRQRLGYSSFSCQ